MSGRKVVCRSYQLCTTPEDLENREILPKEWQPSEVYLAVVIQGAIESALPSAYMEELKTHPNNGNQGTMETPMSFPHDIELIQYSDIVCYIYFIIFTSLCFSLITMGSVIPHAVLNNILLLCYFLYQCY